MVLSVKARRAVRGAVFLPPSKSYSIRAFLIASLGGTSYLIHPSLSDDAKVAMRTAQFLGAQIRRQRNSWTVTAHKNPSRSHQINVQESGTVLRFLLPLLAAKNRKAKVRGEGTLAGRPNKHLLESLRKNGVRIFGQGSQETVPIVIKGGLLKGGHMAVDASLSSQFISALLIAAPLLPADTRLAITSQDVVSETYITMTQQILKKAGIRIKKINRRSYFIKGRQRFKGLSRFCVPSDYGLAAFFLAAGALLPSDITLKGFLGDQFVQADGKILLFLKKLGVTFEKTQKQLRLKGPFRLKGGVFSLKDCPDLVPIMAVLALFAQGRTRLYGIGHARLKESDRISDLKKELLKVGADLREKRDELIIHPRSTYKQNVILDPHQDHRLAMAFSILGLKLGAKIKDIECTRKSYPNFVSDLRRISGI